MARKKGDGIDKVLELGPIGHMVMASSRNPDREAFFSSDMYPTVDPEIISKSASIYRVNATLHLKRLTEKEWAVRDRALQVAERFKDAHPDVISRARAEAFKPLETLAQEFAKVSAQRLPGSHLVGWLPVFETPQGRMRAQDMDIDRKIQPQNMRGLGSLWQAIMPLGKDRADYIAILRIEPVKQHVTPEIVNNTPAPKR